MPAIKQLNHPTPTKNVQALLAAARQRLQQNQLLEAAQCFFEVTRLEPHCFEAFCQLGALLNQLHQLEEACVCLQMAVRLKPNFPKLNLLLGGVLKKLGRFEESAACCRKEIQIEPGNPDAHYNLGLVLQNLGRLDEAIIAYQKAIGLRPEYADALINLGCVRRQRLEPEAALLCFEEALRCEPQNPEAHWELCTTLLALGDFERGWKEYEWRWKQKGFAAPPARFEQPRWDGSDLNGRRIFLHTEQGYGDIIQFARYATLVAGRGGEVIVGCPQPLRLLIQTIPGVREVVTDRAALPPFDVHAPLMSLPAIFGTTLPTVPAEIPYLTPPRNDFKLENTDERQCKVGIVWAGDPSHKNDRNRSLPLNCFSPLMELPGIRWYSLQVGNRVRDLSQLQPEGRITDLGSRFRDFGDTAQAIAQLDLVISVDTSVVHLAGALGKSVWTLLPFEAEWRWMLGREDSPWYSTMRLFRQSSPGNWKSLLDLVACELNKFTARRTDVAANRLFLSTL
jgi:cytochrome c-type biogenesis protein CcmH/NrfG